MPVKDAALARSALLSLGMSPFSPCCGAARITLGFYGSPYPHSATFAEPKELNAQRKSAVYYVKQKRSRLHVTCLGTCLNIQIPLLTDVSQVITPCANVNVIIQRVVVCYKLSHISKATARRLNTAAYRFLAKISAQNSLAYIFAPF